MTAVLAALFVAGGAFAQDSSQVQQPATNDKVWTKVFTAGLFTRYFGTNGASFADEVVVQTSFDLSRNMRGLSVGFNAWSSKGFKTTWQGFSDEIDLMARASRSVGGTTVTGNIGVFFLVPKAKTNVLTVGVKVAKDLRLGEKDKLSVYAGIDSFHLTNRHHSSMHGGKYPSVGLMYQHAFTSKVGVVAQYQYSLDMDGAFGFAKGVHIYRVDTGLNFAVGKVWTLSPKVIYGGTYNDQLRQGKITFGFGLSRVF
jgi:hypothetical protein